MSIPLLISNNVLVMNKSITGAPATFVYAYGPCLAYLGGAVISRRRPVRSRRRRTVHPAWRRAGCTDVPGAPPPTRPRTR
ncbi:MAG: hypothetical protein U0R76_03215 [Candidatus Nanopelagicales bacterium]